MKGRARRWVVAGALALAPSVAGALGSIDVRVTGGPGGYGEGAVQAHLDPWDLFGFEGEVAVGGADGTESTRYYRGEMGVRLPVGLDLDLGASASPAADGLRSRSVYVDASVSGSPWGERMTAVTVTWRRRVYGVRPLQRWEDVEQVSWGVWAAQEVAEGWVVNAEYTGYAYDRDLDRAAQALVTLEFRRRDRDLGFTADRLAVFPARVWGVGLDYHHPSGWWGGGSWSHIVTAVELLEADADRYGLEAGWEFENGVGATVGFDAYVDRDGGETYPYLHLFYDF